jgi:hypothetical protein
MKQMPQGNNLNRKRDYGYGVIEKTEFSSERVQLCVETRIDSTHPCVRSVISSCIREPVEVARVLEF